MSANRLASEKSPYLLQHAHNPVDWYPWGAEALERAKAEEKPILLSIGYAACHWCHVMERESFEDEAIARRMNELFVCVKVDREERPDLDRIYQLVVQLMGRSGGWPLTVFLTPDRRPFFAGTYFPPVDRYGMPGFPKVLDAVADAYAKRRGDVEQQAQELTQAIARIDRVPAERGEPGPDLLRRASRRLLARFDDRYGGFGSRPKFPNPMALEVLLRRGAIEGDPIAASSARLALDRMRAGGIWDQLRGGFHRYSTDERWLVPHFEKMLYDSALLLRLYVDGFRAFGDARHADTARAIVGYLLAEMRAPGGGFFASQDADSEGVEGKFFVWTPRGLEAALEGDAEALAVARSHFGVTDEGNFEETGATVLSEARPLERVAADLGITKAAAAEALARAKARLLAAREERVRPARDDKVLASWNGLAIGALADAGRALDEPAWVEAAAEAFDAIERGLVHDGRVGRYLMNGAPAGPRVGFLDDHAYVGCAALDLWEATHDPRYVRAARAIADATLEHFWDRAGAGFFFTPDDGEELIARTKEVFDQAVPAAAAMAALLCLRLGELGGARYAEAAEKALRPLAEPAAEDAFALGATVLALDRLVRGATEIVIVGPAGAEGTKALARAAFRAYVPNRALAVVDPSRPETVEAAGALAEGKPAREGAPVAYVCRNRTCSAPIDDPAELERALRPAPAA